MTKICVRAIILRQNTLLAVRHKHYKGQLLQETDYWALPGGKVEEGEALIPALEREMIEETAITPKIGDLLYVHQFSAEGNNFIEFFFHVKNADEYQRVDLDKTTHGHQEIAEIAFIDPAQAHILPAFLANAPLAQKAANNSPTELVSYLA